MARWCKAWNSCHCQLVLNELLAGPLQRGVLPVAKRVAYLMQAIGWACISPSMLQKKHTHTHAHIYRNSSHPELPEQAQAHPNTSLICPGSLEGVACGDLAVAGSCKALHEVGGPLGHTTPAAIHPEARPLHKRADHHLLEQPAIRQ